MTDDRSPREITRNGILLWAWPPDRDPLGRSERSGRASSAVYRIPCPYCQAAPGERCSTRTGRQAGFAHQPRIDIATSLIADAVAMTSDWWSTVLTEALTST